MVNAGITHFNISLDTVQPEKYLKITRRNGLDHVKRTLKLLLAYPKDQVKKIKINCVVMQGVNDDEIVDLVEISKSNKLDIRFIEWMPFGGNKWDKNLFVSYDNMTQKLKDFYGNIKII